MYKNVTIKTFILNNFTLQQVHFLKQLQTHTANKAQSKYEQRNTALHLGVYSEDSLSSLL